MKISKGDFGFDIIIAITDETGTPVDLSAIDLTNTKFRIWKHGATNFKVDGVVTFYSDGTDGKLKYIVQSTDFDTVGLYHCEIKLIWQTKQRTIKLEDIVVEEIGYLR